MYSLNENTNYIVSGLERSGTSMVMQILEAGGIPVAHDETRKADINNPKGYYELEGGKIINKLMNETFPLDKYKGKFIKITSYGLQYLPDSMYEILYLERDIEEIIKSTDKISDKWTDDKRKSMKSLEKLNHKVKKELIGRMNTGLLLLGYNNILENPKLNVEMILEFLELPEDNVDVMIKAVDESLYRSKI